MPELRWGLTLPFAGVPLAAHEPLVRRAEAAGYDDLWTGETNGPDGFTPLVLAAAWTTRMRLGTGVVNPFTRAAGPRPARRRWPTPAARFVLGLGSSSDVIVERWNERPFAKPLTRVRESVQVLREILAGGRGPGLQARDAAPRPHRHRRPARPHAAARGELGDRTFVNFLPLSSVEHVVARVREGEAGRDPTEIICRFFCVPGEGLDVARFMFAAYGTVPVYEAFFRALGWGDAIDPMVAAWREGDRKERGCRGAG